MTIPVHSPACACCSDLLRGQFSRRQFIQAAAAGTAALTLSPYFAFAAEGKYEAWCFRASTRAPRKVCAGTCCDAA